MIHNALVECTRHNVTVFQSRTLYGTSRCEYVDVTVYKIGDNGRSSGEKPFQKKSLSFFSFYVGGGGEI